MSDIGGAFLILLYFVPTVVALLRGHRQTFPIAVVNVVFGWTLLGWVVALAWAGNHQPREVGR